MNHNTKIHARTTDGADPTNDSIHSHVALAGFKRCAIGSLRAAVPVILLNERRLKSHHSTGGPPNSSPLYTVWFPPHERQPENESFAI